MGRAIYDFPGLTHRGSLETFWQNPEEVDAKKYTAYRNYLIAKTQLNGSIYTSINNAESAEGVAESAMGVNWCSDKYKLHVQATYDNVVDINVHRKERKISVVDSVVEEVGHGKLAV